MQTDARRRFVAHAGLPVDISVSPAAFQAQLKREIAVESVVVRRLGITRE